MAQNQSLQSVAAKIRCRYGEFLTTEQYKNLAGCPTLLEFVSSLSGSEPFAPIAKLPATALSGKGLADFFQKHYYNDLASLFTLESFLGSSFFQLPILQITAEYLLSFARQYNTGKQFTYPPLPKFFQKHLPFCWESFCSATQYKEVIPLLANHPFQKALAANIPREDAPVNIAALEEGLTEILISIVQTQFSEKENHKDFAEIFSLMIDLENLQKLIRCKRYFPTGTPPCFWEGGSFSKKQLQEWYCLPQKQLEQTLQQTKYGNCFHSDLPGDFALQSVVTNRCRRLLRTTRHIPTMLLAYCLLSKHQKDCLTILAKGIEYRMPASQLMQLAVL